MRERARRPMLAVVGTLLAGFVAASLTASPARHATAATADDLRNQTSAAADDLGVRDAQADAAAAALNDVRTRLAAAQSVLDDARTRLSTARADLVRRQDDLAAAQSTQRIAQDGVDAATATLNRGRDQLRGMVRAALQNGVGSDLDVLMASGTPDDLADRMSLLDHLGSVRKQRIDALLSAQTVLTDQLGRLDAARRHSADAVGAANAQVATVASLVDTARNAQQQLLDLQSQRQQASDNAQAAADAAQARYDALQRASASTAALLAARANTDPGGPPPPAPGHGGLIMPVTGVFTSPFGYRNDPLGRGRRFHAGQDIGAPMGTPIYAATAGTVAYAGWESGYGNYTCIDRGSGFATCYGHQSKILVSVGQQVQQSQLIGLVGSTGNSTGPHLHFEVRINGVPVNPLPYLP